MQFEAFSFGSIRIDGVTYEKDVVIERARSASARRSPSKKYRDEFGHTPVPIAEKITWKCKRLVIGTGTGALTVMDEVKKEAKRRKIELVVVPTAEAISALKAEPKDTNAILHLTNAARAGVFILAQTARTSRTARNRLWLQNGSIQKPWSQPAETGVLGGGAYLAIGLKRRARTLTITT